MSDVSTTPFVMSINKGAPLATAFKLRAALSDNVHLLKPPSVLEGIVCDVERLTNNLIAAEKGQGDLFANSVATTQEKNLARAALYRAMRDISRLGFAICRHDASARESFALTYLKQKPTKKVTAVSPAVGATTTEDGTTTDSTFTPVVTVAEEVEVVVN
jgi:hypothetical protein